MKDYFETSSTCLTGGYPQPLKEYPMHNMTTSTPNHNWQYQQLYQSRMIASMERRDSGVHSMSEGQASSPSSDESERYSVKLQNAPHSVYYFQNRYSEESRNAQNTSYVSSPSPLKDEHNKKEEKGNPSPPPSDYSKDISALQNLQMSVEKNLNISSPEPASQEQKATENNNNNEENIHQEDYSVPTLNSHGKVKMVKCKQCKSIFKTKLEFWTHQREHIKPERLLECEKCPFVTEYKHHLEYHLRNHGGEKPFQCDRCDYKCVNKSMLNSHMKSHSSVYQYRCATCIYNSKYCHSLKLHLRKYGHEPAMVLNPDGTPNPLPIIDVYGTRRGPKLRTTSGDEECNSSSPKRMKTENSPPNPQPQVYPQILPTMPDMSHFQLMAQDREMQLKLQMFQQALLMQTLRMMNQAPGFVNNATPESNAPSSPTQETEENSVLDLSKDKTTEINDSSNIEVKMDTPSTSDDEDEERMKLLYNVKVEHDVGDETSERPGGPTPPAESTSPPPCAESLRCPHCCITFDDIALFTIHMRFHNFSDPFTCNSCGQKCENKIEFTVHIFSKPH